MRDAFRQLPASDRGATLVEFALILLPLCMCLLGLLDLGYQIYVRAVLQGAANDVARAVAIESPNLGGTGTLENQVGERIEARMAGLAGSDAVYQITSTTYYRHSDVGRPERLTRDNNRNGRHDPGDCWSDTNPNGATDRPDTESGRTGIGGADDVVQFRIRLQMPRIAPVAGLWGGSSSYDIAVGTAIKRQPFADQQQPTERCSSAS